jgi:hypothetical protein
MTKEFTRTYRITFKDTEDGHTGRDYNITRINNFLKMKDDHMTLLFLLDLGIKTSLEEIAKTGDAEAQLEVDIQEKLLEYKRMESRWSNLNKLYDKMPAEEFQQFCANKNIPISNFLEWREKKAMDSWADKARHWLDALLSDGNPVQTSAVKQIAMESGLIDPIIEKQQWDYLKLLAHRQGYTGKAYGCWQRGADANNANKADF